MLIPLLSRQLLIDIEINLAFLKAAVAVTVVASGGGPPFHVVMPRDSVCYRGG